MNWDAIDRLLDGARTTDTTALRAHRVHLLAAKRWRATGRAVSADLAGAERATAVRVLAAPILLRRLSGIVSGPIVLIKGIEIATHYPDQALRPFEDIDLFVPDAERSQREVLAAGFESAEGNDGPVRYHHLTPVRWPDSPLAIEIHHSLPHPVWITPPANETLFAAAVPSTMGVDGISTLLPVHHTLLLAAHAWRHGPLSRLIDIIDVAAASDGVPREELDAVAQEWGMSRVWTTTVRAADALLGEDLPQTWPLRLWARHLASVRQRNALERLAADGVRHLMAPVTPSTFRAGLSVAARAIR